MTSSVRQIGSADIPLLAAHGSETETQSLSGDRQKAASRPQRMTAIRYDQFGGAEVLHITEAAMPALAANSVLVAMHATSVNVVDIKSREGALTPLVDKKFPKTPGADVAGVVVQVGAKVKNLKVGDAVFGSTNPFKGGAFADYVAVPEAQMAKKPDAISFEQAATLPIAALAALQSLRELGKVKRGQHVLIYGATGATGLYAIQLAKGMGAHVTAVSGPPGIETAKAMGADVTLNYKAGPVALAGPYDVILDYSAQFPFAKARHSLTPTGRYIDAMPTIPKVIGSKIANLFRSQKNQMLMTKATQPDLDYVAGLVVAGTLLVTIAQTYPLKQAVRAFRHHEAGGTVGKIVVTNAKS